MQIRAAIRGRRLPLLLILAVLLAAGAAYAYLPRTPAEETRRTDAARLMNDLMAGKGQVGGPFTLTDHHGHRKSLSDFRGKLMLLYFGYTYCPDVCPTDLLAIGEAINALGASGEDVQPVFVTLDPERDTRKVLRAYAPSFHPRFVALTGTPDEIRQVATAYKVFFEKVRPATIDTYLIDHAAFTFLLDREGRYVGFFPPGTPAERIKSIVAEQVARKDAGGETRCPPAC